MGGCLVYRGGWEGNTCSIVTAARHLWLANHGTEAGRNSSWLARLADPVKFSVMGQKCKSRQMFNYYGSELFYFLKEVDWWNGWGYMEKDAVKTPCSRHFAEIVSLRVNYIVL